MKKNRIVSFILALIVSSKAFAVDGGVKNNFTKQQSDTLRKYLWKFPVNTQLSIALVQNDKVIYQGIIVDNDSFHVVENRDSVFEIGSFTKVFTSEILSAFVDKGTVKLSDHIQDLFNFPLKESSKGGKEITLEMLANHTSGLPRVDMSMITPTTDINDPYKEYDENMLVDYLKNKMKLDTVPGTNFSYSNLGGGLLGYILCQKEHKTYEELLQQNICIPLEMKSTTTMNAYIKDRLVKGRNKDGAVTSNWTFTDATAGAGAVKSCATDMVKFVQANFIPNKVLDLPRIKTFAIKKPTPAGMGGGLDIGLGWMIKTDEDKNTIYWHDGGTGGYRSCTAMNVNKKTGVVILSNVSSFHPQNANIDKLCGALLNTLK